jgi:hypothetical protein
LKIDRVGVVLAGRAALGAWDAMVEAEHERILDVGRRVLVDGDDGLLQIPTEAVRDVVERVLDEGRELLVR